MTSNILSNLSGNFLDVSVGADTFGAMISTSGTSITIAYKSVSGGTGVYSTFSSTGSQSSTQTAGSWSLSSIAYDSSRGNTWTSGWSGSTLYIGSSSKSYGSCEIFKPLIRYSTNEQSYVFMDVKSSSSGGCSLTSHWNNIMVNWNRDTYSGASMLPATNGDERIEDVVYVSGSFYVVGHTNGDFDNPFNPNRNNHDAFVHRLTSGGTVSWTWQPLDSINDKAMSVYVDNLSRVWVVGEYWGDQYGNATSMPNIVIYQLRSSDGLLQQRKIIESTNGFAVGTGIVYHSTQNRVIISATVNGTINGLTSSGASDMYLFELKVSDLSLSGHAIVGGAGDDISDKLLISGTRVWMLGLAGVGTVGGLGAVTNSQNTAVNNNLVIINYTPVVPPAPSSSVPPVTIFVSSEASDIGISSSGVRVSSSVSASVSSSVSKSVSSSVLKSSTKPMSAFSSDYAIVETRSSIDTMSDEFSLDLGQPVSKSNSVSTLRKPNAANMNNAVKNPFFFPGVTLMHVIYAAASLGALILVVCAGILIRRRRVQKYRKASSSQGLDKTPKSSKRGSTSQLLFHTKRSENGTKRMQDDSVYSNGMDTVLSATSTVTATAIPDYHEISVPGFLEMSNADFRTLGKPLSSGAAAQVFRGEVLRPTVNIDFPVAIKLLKFDTPEERDALKQEVAIMQYMTNCPRSIRLLGFCMAPMAIIMKFYDLGTLDAFIENKKNTFEGASYTLAVVRLLVLDLAEAIRFMHSADIVHNDLKPVNVLLELDEEYRFRAVLTDYGVSIFATKESVVSGMKYSRIFGGTPAYASPELLKKLEGKVSLSASESKACDCYSFGMIFFSMMIRAFPWGSAPNTEINARVLNAQMPDLRASQYVFPSSSATTMVHALIDSLLQTRAELRPTIDDVYDRLDALKLK